MSQGTERKKLIDLLRARIVEIQGPLNNIGEARHLTEKLYEISKESNEGGVLRRAFMEIWSLANDKTDTIPNGKRSPEIAYYMGIRNAMDLFLHDGFGIAQLIDEEWDGRLEQIKAEEREKLEQEEFLKNRPPAD